MKTLSYWEWGIEPCRISDQFYYVGTTKGPAHLLTTSDGLVLIDTGYAQSLYMLLESLRKLGFDYKDIKHIVHTHGHIDHIGGTRALVELTGAKTYIGRHDADMVRGINGLDWCSEFDRPFDEPFEPDVLIADGDEIAFGDTVIRFVETPGHTAGTLSLFFDLTDNGKTYRAGLFGGAGTNTLRSSYFLKYGVPFSMRETFVASIDKVINEPVEIHIGNHLSDNDHKSKAALVGQGPNPFIDPTSWKNFLSAKREAAIQLIKEQAMNKQEIIKRIEEEKIIVILRGYGYEDLYKTVAAMHKGGIRCCEVTYDSLGTITDEQTASHIASLCRDFPDMLVGAGTVLTEKQVELTAKAGGKFIISPDTNPDVIKKTVEMGLVSIPGSLTPTEATLAHRSGADFVKLFPNGEMKPTYLKALVAPLSHIKFLAVGGVDTTNIAEMLKMGARGVGIATGIANKKLVLAGKFDEITELARQYVAAAKENA